MPRPPLHVRWMNRILERWEPTLGVEQFLGLRLVGPVLVRDQLKAALARLAEADPQGFRRVRARFDALTESVRSGWSERRADVTVKLGAAPTYAAAELSWLATASLADARFGSRRDRDLLASRLSNRAWLRTALLCAEHEQNPQRWRAWAHEVAEGMAGQLSAPQPSWLARLRENSRLIRDHLRELRHREWQH